MSEPRFSIVIPLYNREREIVRALKSCLDQMTQEFEIVVVDDASTDGSAAVVRQYLSDTRIRLILQEKNGGEWSARSKGIANARGEWIIWLDSDDEFLPGGLKAIQEAADEYGAEFDRLGFEYLYDSGGKSPLPAVKAPTVLDLPGYIKWFANIIRSDALWVAKRYTFARVPVPLGRQNHLLYAFTFNSTYRTLLLPVTVGAVHTDSENRLSAMRAYTDSVRSQGDARRSEMDAILEKFGAEILAVSPAAHRTLSRTRILSSILAGRRWLAAKSMFFHARYHLTAEILSLMLLIVAGSRVTFRVSAWQHARREHSRSAV